MAPLHDCVALIGMGEAAGRTGMMRCARGTASAIHSAASMCQWCVGLPCLGDDLCALRRIARTTERRLSASDLMCLIAAKPQTATTARHGRSASLFAQPNRRLFGVAVVAVGGVGFSMKLGVYVYGRLAQANGCHEVMKRYEDGQLGLSGVFAQRTSGRQKPK